MAMSMQLNRTDTVSSFEHWTPIHSLFNFNPFPGLFWTVSVIYQDKSSLEQASAKQ